MDPKDVDANRVLVPICLLEAASSHGKPHTEHRSTP
jgi:hypothetical protein